MGRSRGAPARRGHPPAGAVVVTDTSGSDEIATPRSLRSQTLQGVGWTAGSQTVRQLVQVVVGIILARLLVPAEFGLYAMVAVFSGFVNVVADLGLGGAIVQAPSLSERQLSTAFWVNAAACLGFGGLVALVGPLIADFYGEGSLVGLALLVGASVSVAIVAAVHRALLLRAMRFRAVAAVEATAVVVGGLAAVVAASAGAGAASMGVQSLTTGAVGTIGLVVLCRWRPTWTFDLPEVHDLMRFGANLTGFAGVNYWSRNGDNLLIGRFAGADQLGFYSRAYSLMLLPVTQVTQVLGRVMLVTFSRMQDDLGRVRHAYLRSVTLIAVVTFPLLAGAAAAAPDLLPAVLGSGWADAVPIFQVLALAGVPQTVGTTTGWIYQSQGRADLLFRWGVVSAAVTGVAFVVGIQWGAMGVAVAYVVRTYVLSVWAFQIAGNLIRLPVSAIWRCAWGPLAGSSAMAASILAVGHLVDLSHGSAAVVEVATGVLTYGLIAFGLRPRSFVEAWELVGEEIHSRRQRTAS